MILPTSAVRTRQATLALLPLAMAACAGPSPPLTEPPPTPVVSPSTTSSSPVSAALPPSSAAPLPSATSSASAEPPAIAVKLPHCEELAKVYCSSAFRSFDGGNKCGEIHKDLAAAQGARDPTAAAALDERCKRSYPSAIGAIKR